MQFFEMTETLAVRKLFFFWYFELKKSYYSKRDMHDFWEFIYIDKGEYKAIIDSEVHELRQGHIIFYKPNGEHEGRAYNGTTPHLMAVGFECQSPQMRRLENKVIDTNEEERIIISKILSEGVQLFGGRPTTKPPSIASDPPFGSGHLLKSYLETLFIYLIRRSQSEPQSLPPDSVNKKNLDNQRLREIVAFMMQAVPADVSLPDLCQRFGIGKSQMNSLFKSYTGYSPIQYFHFLRIEHAKSLIRKESLSFSEISDRLGYNSIHYFSRQFKKITDMTPTEYARSIKAKIPHYNRII